MTDRPNRVSRRTLAKGAAWAAPTVLMATGAPANAVASMPNTAWGFVCALNYGAYDGMSGMRHRLWFDVDATTAGGVVPVGSTFSWTICVTPGPAVTTWEIPIFLSNSWVSQTLSPAAGTLQSGTACFTYTVRFTTAYAPDCTDTQSTFGLEWNDANPLPDQSTISITGGGESGVGGVNSGGTMALTYVTPNRNQDGGTNPAKLEPHYYKTRSGTQTFWPSIHWTTYAGNQQNGEDNVTCYPAGTTVIPTAERCTWNEPTGTCLASATGLCSPKFTNTSNGGAQWIQPKIY